jgi:hypothetical protein
MENKMTHTSWELSLVIKITIAKFFNTCLIPLVGNPREENWFVEYGLTGEVYTLIVAVFFGEILRVVFYPKFIIKWVVRTYETSKGENSDITQREANMLYENDDVVFGKHLSVILAY